MLSTSSTRSRLLLLAALSTQITNAMAQTRCYYDRYNQRRCYRQSAWNTWVRWVVLAVIVIGFLLLFFLCSCITARRRRKAGRQPFYGTGWAARPNGNTAQPYYNNNYNTAPAPPYSAATHNNNNGGYYGNGANQSYYGQQNGVELQSPQPTYGGNQQYAPPPGPPPGKDGIIR
ncbi:chitin synthesis regulation, resistance to congo red-domain-containing protein [Boeremia exigua]|uniref:chitin synthesis regulation, resistance to congo red-domain-containing protein n=1 Tax=Boeremia exigua TaxID=749465 RepID=UPI001E8E9C0B|nr:chitin synthesis regulation, resistance to congo red-domain-containing protein [Boeremia exigua]KAH6643893.1 chitin synthesis regulation, resistance to congo red-domain-containing protein [Boeremia exigua]